MKLLGKADFKKIMKWRTAIREEQTKAIIAQKRADKEARLKELGEDHFTKKHAPLTDDQIDEVHSWTHEIILSRHFLWYTYVCVDSYSFNSLNI